MDKPLSPAEVGEAGARIIQALVELAKDRPELRSALRTLLSVAESDSSAESAEGSVALVEKVLTPRSLPAREEASSRPPRKVELSVIVRRARWKAAACRVAIDKRGSDDEETARQEENLRRQRSSLEDCWAWMLDGARTLPEDQLLQDVAQCYDAVALAAETALNLEEIGALDPKPPAELLYLLAEAQSGLLSALHKCDLRGDSDQRDLFLWLKDQTTKNRIYVDRHMRLDDPADSTASPDLVARLDTLFERRKGHAQRGRLRTQLLNKVRYHRGKASGSSAVCEADLRAVEAACAEWIDAGLQADDEELGSLVGEVVSQPAQAGDATCTVLAAVTQKEPAPVPRDVLGECRALIQERNVLLFGLEGQADEAAGLAQPLGLASLRFVALDREGDAMARIEEELRDQPADLVLIGYRLPPEDYSVFKTLCMELEHPFVRLPGGLRADLVAHQVLRQVAWRLRQEASKG